MLFTIEAETAEELRAKLVEVAKVFGGAEQPRAALAGTVTEEGPKKRGPKPKGPKPAETPTETTPVKSETTVSVTSTEPVTADVHVEPAAAAATTDDEAKVYTIEDVRAAAQKLTTAKGIPAAMAVAAEFDGVKRLAELKPEHYKAFIRRANAEANRK